MSLAFWTVVVVQHHAGNKPRIVVRLISVIHMSGYCDRRRKSWSIRSCHYKNSDCPKPVWRGWVHDLGVCLHLLLYVSHWLWQDVWNDNIINWKYTSLNIICIKKTCNHITNVYHWHIGKSGTSNWASVLPFTDFSVQDKVLLKITMNFKEHRLGLCIPSIQAADNSFCYTGDSIMGHSAPRICNYIYIYNIYIVWYLFSWVVTEIREIFVQATEWWCSQL